jgi:hypothetical protein
LRIIEIIAEDITVYIKGREYFLVDFFHKNNINNTNNKNKAISVVLENNEKTFIKKPFIFIIDNI